MAEYVPYIVGGVATAVVTYRKYKKNKKKYKDTKEAIYETIKQSIEKNDFAAIVEGASELQRFDTVNSESRGILDKAFGRKLPKMDKVEKMFNISKDIIMDIEKLKQTLSTEPSSKLIKQLTIIEEEEKKETEIDKKVRIGLQKIKRRYVAKHNEERRIVDGFSYTNSIEELTNLYEEYLNENIKSETDDGLLLKRNMKKQMIMKRLQQQQYKSQESNSVMC